jgi:hypothetical protein
MDTYDYLVVGGGIFGVYAALYLSRRNYKVCLIEQEEELMTKASIVNQARLHGGYHYPRSVATARIADDYKERFTQDHKQFINRSFKQYYAIDKYSSFTDAGQFERFCNFLSIKCEPVKEQGLFDFTRIQELYLTEEHSFDPLLIAQYYKELLKAEKNITLKLNSRVLEAENVNGRWKVMVLDKKGNTRSWMKACAAINATYSGTNTVNVLFGINKMRLMHEICELAFISSSHSQEIGLTVMDGSFCSIMPYGLSGLLCLSSVVYTVHSVSYGDEPAFACQSINTECRPDHVAICDSCKARPRTNQYKMIRQMGRYFKTSIKLDYLFSMYTIKSKLQASYIDDGRPTVISKLHGDPDYYGIFAGKINSIYEIERVLELR